MITPPSSLPSLPFDSQDEHRAVPALVGALFEVAQPSERGRLLEYLLPPLGVLALVTVANGVFANIRFNGVKGNGHVPLEEALKIRSGDVAALVDRLQLVSVDAVDGLAQLVMASPVLASTAAAALLLAVLTKRAKSREKQLQPHQPSARVGR